MKGVAWAFVTLGLSGLVAAPVYAQVGSQDTRVVQLEPNYPNPFNRETTIPFTLSEDLWANGNRPVVSVRVYNVLAQLVAVPVSSGDSRPLDGVELEWNGTGRYLAQWDGTVRGTNRRAASGVYVCQLTVNGMTDTRRMTVIR